MTNDELQAHIKAIEEALERGEIEEALSDNEHWIPPRNNGVLLNGAYRYRIKPKPLECWVNVYSDGREATMAHESAALATAKANIRCDALERVAVHMREVTDD